MEMVIMKMIHQQGTAQRARTRRYDFGDSKRDHHLPPGLYGRLYRCILEGAWDGSLNKTTMKLAS